MNYEGIVEEDKGIAYASTSDEERLLSAASGGRRDPADVRALLEKGTNPNVRDKVREWEGGIGREKEGERERKREKEREER